MENGGEVLGTENAGMQQQTAVSDTFIDVLSRPGELLAQAGELAGVLC
jgi:hypothetical protein